jgi:hypothetical protein
VRNLSLSVKDKVLLALVKLDKLYAGPFEVIKIEGLNVSIKDKNNKIQIVHINRLIKYH